MLWRRVRHLVRIQEQGKKSQTQSRTGQLTNKYHLSLGDVHEYGKAGHVVTLTTDVAVVPVEHLTSFSGPAACTSNPKRQNRNLQCIFFFFKFNQIKNTTNALLCYPTHAKEWFQNTQTGLVLSSVSSSVYSKMMGGSRIAGRGGPSLCTVALTMAVLITGRFGSLGKKHK